MEIRGTSAYIGMNKSSVPSQLKEGELTFALNAVIESFDGNTVTYQNEQGNFECVKFPEGFRSIGQRNILEKNFTVFMLANPTTGESEIGRVFNDSCTYEKLINANCLAFDIKYPIHKIVTKITNCTTELYWTDTKELMRWIDLENLPIEPDGSIDCNRLNVQPSFSIPVISYKEVGSDGELVEGTYQFAVQYSSSQGDPYTSVYSVTHPLSIHEFNRISPDFNLLTSKSITFNITNIDTSGVFNYLNIIVIKTINNIPEIELIETRRINSPIETVTYTGTSKSPIKLSPNELFERFPIYGAVKDVFTVGDILGWAGLTLPSRKSYQKIFNKVHLQWETFILNTKKKNDYSKPLNTGLYRGYMRDEVYALEGVFELTRGRQTDSFPIPCRLPNSYDLEVVTGPDTVVKDEDCEPNNLSQPRYKVYNTASKIGFTPAYLAGKDDTCYEGSYEYGEFAYSESTDTYPYDQSIWGELAGKPIRHHRFPDSSITHIHDNDGNIFPIGIRIDIDEIKRLVRESDLTEEEKAEIVGIKIVRGNRAANKSVVAKGLLYNVGKYRKDRKEFFYPNYIGNDVRKDPFLSNTLTKDDSGENVDIKLDGFSTADSKQRFTFHSPDTHFYQPTLGNELKLETIEYGQQTGHFVQVKKHARYKFLTTGSYIVTLGISIAVGVASMSLGLGSNQIFDGTAAFTAFNALTGIIEKTIPRYNFAYQFNAVGNYDKFVPVQNDLGTKIRSIDIVQYLLSGMNTVGDTHTINNFQRESSVYVKTSKTLPFPHELGGPQDQSKWTLTTENLCDEDTAILDKPISSFYASIKRKLANQYGTINSYEVIDTGYFRKINAFQSGFAGTDTIFGGDVFINKFALKRKMPFFIDNRVGFDDESDVFYNQLGNVAYPTYWLSTDYRNDDTDDEDIQEKVKGLAKKIKKLFGVKINNFDCRDDEKFYQKGKFYLNAYAIANFYCESEVNVDFRQASNDKEGDFYPRVGTDIPDEWLQEINVPIAQDNTYVYNKTFSKQIKEELFSHLPLEYKDLCETNYPNKVIWSDKQSDKLNYKKNSWLLYRPISQFDLPLNYGALVSLEGIENRAILARFENKSLLYNSLITIDTSSPQAAYIGNDKLFSGPIVDFAETDTGFNGTQNKFFLKTKKGNISVDAKRGQVILMQGNQAVDLAGNDFKMEGFFHENLPFKIKKYFPTINTDNHFLGLGLHGVYDTKYNRLILTKLDYEPVVEGITEDNGSFFLNGEEVSLNDSTYFCNKSFTISFDFDNSRWISFHSYLPNFYVEHFNFFVAGLNEDTSSVWIHNKDVSSYNNFFGSIHPYILEYPFSFKMQEEILQSIKDSTKVFRQINDVSSVMVHDVYFNKAIIRNDQQCSGLLLLNPKPKNRPLEYLKYPIYTPSGKEILFTKSDRFYNYNMFHDVVKDRTQPIMLPSCSPIDEALNESNMNYNQPSFKKEPIRGSNTIIRHIQDETSSYRMISEFVLAKTQISYK